MSDLPSAEEPEAKNLEAEELEAAMMAPELDVSDLEARLSFLNVNVRYLVPELEKEHLEIKRALPKAYNFQMRSELRRLRSFLSLKPLSTWCPKIMASDGFYHTGVKDSIQCFCCGLVLCSTSLRKQPHGEHLQRSPNCKFIQGAEVGNIPKYDVRVQEPANHSVENPERYSSEEARLGSFKSWPFYSRIDPKVLVLAGFFFTGKRDTVRCFSCGGCLGHWMEEDDPWKEHAKWFPDCQFLRSMKSQDEIAEYIESYSSFVGITGKHFITPLITEISPKEEDDSASSIFADERVRLESFKRWPLDAHAEPTSLAKVGFFYSGWSDEVQCFSCGLQVHRFEPGDDPWTDHMKFSSTCPFLSRNVPAKDNVVKPGDQPGGVSLQDKEESGRTEDNHSPLGNDASVNTKRWLEEANKLNQMISRVYREENFRKIPSFGDATHIAIDLKLLHGDIVLTSKDSMNQPLVQLTFPEVLQGLDSITMVEGETGSGKTALLKKIAILWASGCCPMLNRFSLVIYLSLNSTELEQSLSDMINAQLLGPTGSITETRLKEIIQHLKNRVLFLFDDYGEMDSVPDIIEELISKNYLNKLCLVFTTHTHRSGRLRRFAKEVLSLAEFPLYSSIYLCRQLFLHNIPLVEKFFIALAKSKTLQICLKTPMFTLALCVFWVQHPSDNILSEIAFSKSYLLYVQCRFSKDREKLNALTSSCGDLALKGLFKSCFDFSNEDLCEVGLNGDEALKFGLLSKFTAQRLCPVYRFFHPSFQEFLASARLSELFESNIEKDLKTALSYLDQVNTFLKAAGRFFYFLRYACRTSKSTSIIISHLFSLFNRSESFSWKSDKGDYLQQHPELEDVEDNYSLLVNDSPDIFRTLMIKKWLEFAIETSHAVHSLDACSPIILQFLTGKSIKFYMQSLPQSPILQFFTVYPESLSLLSSVTVSLQGKFRESHTDLSDLKNCYPFGIPTTERDYSHAFTLCRSATQAPFSFDPCKRTHLLGIPDFWFVQSDHKIPVLIIDVSKVIEPQEHLVRNLMVLMSVSTHIKLSVSSCKGFIDMIRPAIEQYKDSFTGFSATGVELCDEQQQLILLMSSLESLEIDIQQISQNPDQLFSHLDKFKKLKHLSIRVSVYSSGNYKTLDCLRNIRNIETFKMRIGSTEGFSSGIVDCIRASKDLTVFHLKCNSFAKFESLVTAMSFCKNLQELRLCVVGLTDDETTALASVLSEFSMLKVLNLNEQYFYRKVPSEAFASSLSSLVHLEVLNVPHDFGILETAIDIIQQFQYLRNLKILSFRHSSLNDHSILELAMAARDGYLEKINTLELLTIHEITESGWRSFLETLDNMPVLSSLNLARMYTHQIKCQAATVKALVQCVSRLPSLTYINITSWLLDEDDIKMFNAMKERHPQAKRLDLKFQWILPFLPILQD